MAPKIDRLRLRKPRRRVDCSRGYFYPAEVVRILKLEGIDYHQLRRVFGLVLSTGSQGVPQPRKWSRFSFRDLLGVQVVIRLAGGKEALQPGGRLQLKQVETACERLRREFGIADPLITVLLKRKRGKIAAFLEDIAFEPISGQLLLFEVESAVDRYFDSADSRINLNDRTSLKAAFRKERSVLGLPAIDDIRDPNADDDHEHELRAFLL